MRTIVLPFLMLGAAVSCSSVAAEPPSRPGVDAPELARLGEFVVSARTVTLVHRDQVDVLAFDPDKGTAPRRDRPLTVDIWYPAHLNPPAVAETYTASLPSEPPDPPASFSIPGLAVRDARPVAGGTRSLWCRTAGAMQPSS